MFEYFRDPFKKMIQPIARALVSLGVSANMVTVAGAFGTIVVAIATGISGWMFPGALLLTILVIFDSLDGTVASLTTGGTPFGAFLDSTLDRIADWAVLVAVTLYFMVHGSIFAGNDLIDSRNALSWVGFGAALYAMMTSFVTSYARARAESVGYEAKKGIATRSDRLVIVLVGMGLTGLTGDERWLMGFMLLLSLLGTITVAQRMRQVYQQMQSNQPSTSN